MNKHLKHYLPFKIALLGITGTALILVGLTFMLSTAEVHAQPPDDAEYIGDSDCASCHISLGRSHGDSRHSRTMVKVEREPEAVVADFNQGEEVRQVQFPGEDAPRAFTLEDIAYTIGTGRHLQGYLYELESGGYAVLPAEWNADDGVWQPYGQVENWPDESYDWTQNCAGCHTTGLNPERGKWEDAGVQCESCHGPGSAHADAADDAGPEPSDSEMEEIRGAIVLSPDPQICGQCHNQGTSPESGLPYPADYVPGGTLVADGVYQLVAPDDEAHWRASGHASSPNMQYNEWLVSGHANALNTMKMSDYADASCLECHSADAAFTQYLIDMTEAGDRPGDIPDPATLDSAQFGVTCVTCHTMHGETSEDYQLVAEPYTLCTTCHSDNNNMEEIHHPVQEMFEGLPIVDEVEGQPSNHFLQGAECTTCHMPLTQDNGSTWYSGSHTMSPALPGAVTGDQPDSCTSCHTDLSQEYMQQFVVETQDGIDQRLSDLHVNISSNTDVEDWVKTIFNVVAGDGSHGIHNYAYTTSLLDAAELELGITQASVPPTIPSHPVTDPTECAECHENEYREWQLSPHANASLSETFRQKYADDGRPSYCMSCHATGYDPRTQEYVFEGVTCSNCHYVTSGAEHPPGPVEVATDSAVCGQCHSGEHAPTYDEWLTSSHAAAGIDCADCHTAHDNGLILEDVNTTCGSCHEAAKVDEIHMGSDMNCVDCHMTREVMDNGIQVSQTGHSMFINPGTCAECHGDTHLLSASEGRLSEPEIDELAVLRDEVTNLQDTAEQNLNSGIVGGALGALILVVIAYLAVRLGRSK
ncbi:MAG: ammonia-forming cytochrome c nitrite reductase subunit c552 [Anaerolineae bacterium]|nr:ammonia-forming cytochrome c nitrite reductase subunit c552 [Anaerolineae bacterium]